LCTSTRGEGRNFRKGVRGIDSKRISNRDEAYSEIINKFKILITKNQTQALRFRIYFWEKGLQPHPPLSPLPLAKGKGGVGLRGGFAPSQESHSPNKDKGLLKRGVQEGR